jgi:hypothetical protein
MEKYRKFDDASCGINPFVPLPEKTRPSTIQALRNVSYTCVLMISIIVIEFGSFIDKVAFLDIIAHHAAFYQSSQIPCKHSIYKFN